jgi:hypothetical protein
MLPPKDISYSLAFLEKLEAIFGTVAIGDVQLDQIEMAITQLPLHSLSTTIVVVSKNGVWLAVTLWSTSTVVYIEALDRIDHIVDSSLQSISL